MTTKTKTGGILLLTLAALAGCVQATASDNATITKSVSFPPLPVQAGVSGTVAQSTTADISGALSSLSNIGDVSLSFPSDTLSDPSGNSLDWLQSVSITIQPQQGQLLAPVVLTNYVVGSNPGSSITLPLTSDTKTLIQYLEENGGVAVSFSLTGRVPTGGITLDWSLTAHADISVNKGL